jgi:hypothetical protein
MALFSLGGSIDPETGDKVHRAGGRFLERIRWLIYGLILLSILLLMGVAVLRWVICFRALRGSPTRADEPRRPPGRLEGCEALRGAQAARPCSASGGLPGHLSGRNFASASCLPRSSDATMPR